MTREEATEKIKMILEEATEDENAVCYVTSCDADALDMAIKALEQSEPVRKTGKWINVDGSTNTADCSCCGNRGRAWMNYCYECGSTMKGGVICNAED